MSQAARKRAGLIIGREWDWPEAFMTAVNERDAGVHAELVKLSGAFMEDNVAYDVIIDRISHEIPYYRAYLQHAATKGCYVINNPFTWSADNKFFGAALAHRLGLRTPRTVALPNKEIERDVVPESFRNLEYPMDWQGIIDYVGVPAIFKDVRSGGRRQAVRVHSVEELIKRYDESGSRTMILQQLIDTEMHIHSFVIGQEQTLLLRYDQGDGRYLPGVISTEDEIGQTLRRASLTLTRAYQYDINMVEFVLEEDGEPCVINSTNPAPVINRTLMTGEQFNWLVAAAADLVISRAKRPLPQQAILQLDGEQ